jgi:hypothetical protein
MPVLGIVASQISGHLWAPSGAYDSIATTTVGAGGTTNIDFTSIPSTYTHLQIRGFIRSGAATTTTGIGFRTGNGSFDTGANYSDHVMIGDGSAVTAGADASATYCYIPNIPGANATASIFAGFVIDILDYASTSKNKTIRTLAGFDSNGSGRIAFSSGAWYSTSAINQIRLYSDASSGVAQYSQIALYGIKGA